MYFPYLRGKQFELIALREFSERVPNATNITPIIEPVKSEFAGLTNAIKLMFQNQLHFALILNPNDGDFKRINKDILSEIPELKSNASWTPAFLHQRDTQKIHDIISQHDLKDVMIVFKNSIDLSNTKIVELLSLDQVQYIVNGDSNSKVIMRKLKGLNKHIIRLDDCFVEQQRNADYSNIPEDKFTEEHRFYTDDGFYGIADYTALPKDFIDGGMLPSAIAIHLTYEKSQDEIYVRHFVSDTTKGRENIQRKFFEAAIKVKEFFQTTPKTDAVSELIQLLDEERYPGLGVLKKLSIKNHIELMNQIFSV
jgi:hypothetical protein